MSESVYKRLTPLLAEHNKHQLINIITDRGQTITRLEQQLKEVEGHADVYREALEHVAKGCGRYSADPLTHASNTIEGLVEIAQEALSNKQSKDEWRPIITANKSQHLLLLGYNGIIYSAKHRAGRMGEPQQSIIDWRSDCSGRFGVASHWRSMLEKPALNEQEGKDE